MIREGKFMLEMLAALVLGIIFTVIGYGAEVKWLYLIGVLIMPLALLWGAFYKAGDDTKLKITLLAMAGILLAAIVMSSFSLSIYS
jgi:hypothetical protein